MVVQLAGRRVELSEASAELRAAAAGEGALVFIGEHLDESWLRLRLSAAIARSAVSRASASQSASSASSPGPEDAAASAIASRRVARR